MYSYFVYRKSFLHRTIKEHFYPFFIQSTAFKLSRYINLRGGKRKSFRRAAINKFHIKLYKMINVTLKHSIEPNMFVEGY